MSDEIRIYYESLEQAQNYIKPLIESGLKSSKIKLSLIKLKKDYLNYSKKVAPLIYWKDPDILITWVSNEKEIPLVMIEFSTAVFTEDHELQRFDGLAVAAKNNCIYVKISPLSKKSQSGEHGGKTDFDSIGPYAVILQKFDKLFYHFDWKCDSKGDLIVDENRLACPKNLKEFEFFLKNLTVFVKKNKLEEKWINEFTNQIVKYSPFKEWENSLRKFEPLKIDGLKSSRTTWDLKSKELVLKLNRFGHAMDPERGMLAYYGTIYDNVISKMTFYDNNNSWFKATGKEKNVAEYIKKNGLLKGYDFLYCFVYGAGLNRVSSIIELLEKYKESKEDFLEIDFNDILKNNYFKLSKPMRTIFRYSKYLMIADKEDKTRLLIKWGDFPKEEKYDTHLDITQIINKRSLDEDDLTYITVYDILKPNGYKVLASSYPGAQGDRVILVSPGTGRGQERTYVDIIAYLPKKHTTLQENKGKFSSMGVQEDIEKVSLFKKNKSYIKALESFISRYDKNAPKSIKIGVGFWANKNFTISKIKDLRLDDLDYFVYINYEMTKWNIWSSGKSKLFKKTCGKLNLPLTFEVG